MGRLLKKGDNYRKSVRKLSVQQQLAQLDRTEDKTKFLATPYLVKHRFEETLDIIEAAGERYCGLAGDI